MYPDISHHHPVKDWSKVKKNCPFIITKATQGTKFVDSTLKSIVSECEKRKIPYWLYVYLDKGNELAQTKSMVKTCKPLVGKYFVGYCLDVEAGNSASNVQNALKYLEGLGHKVMIYHMYADYTKYKSVIAKRGKNTAWWEARYGLNDGKYHGAYPCHKGVDLHQYTSNGKVDYISGRIDLNRIVGKSESWFQTPLNLEGVAKEVIAGEWGNGEERKKRLEKAGYDYRAVQNIVNDLLRS